MRPRRLTNLGAGAVILGAAASLLFTLSWMPPRTNPEAPAAVGAVLAGEALRALQPGGRLTVITRDTTAFKHPETDLLFRSFSRTIRQGGRTIAAVQALQVDPLRPVDVPPGDFFEWIRKSPPGSVIVSLMGPPLLMPDQLAQLGNVKTDIIAFCPGSLAQRVDLRLLFQAHLLRMAVVSRSAVPPASRPPRGPAAWFDRLYVKLTAANVGSWYDSSGSGP
ncbi:MAG: hypothetical protein ABSC03_01785 [Verrucomicrobiota bacterium]|jgi:hypothetical protein